MRDDLRPLLDRIRQLADEQPGCSPERLLEEMEHTLTDGYALALALEGEGMRIEKEIGAAGAGGDAGHVAVLLERQEATRGELRSLRAHLASLRIRTEAVRAAVPVSR